MFIERPPYLYRLHIPGAIWRFAPSRAAGSPPAKDVFITFDDGPIPEATPFILDELARRGVKATFFVVGDNVRKYPALFSRIMAEGHSFGNHTMHHVQSLRLSSRDYLADVALARPLVPSRLFRPPHGFVKPWIISRLRACGYTIVMHDVLTRDYARGVDHRQILHNVRRLVRPGSIIVFHDSLRSIDKLRHALPMALDWLIDSGYSLKPIPMP